MSYDLSSKILLLLADARQEHTDDEIIDAIPVPLLKWLLDTYKIPKISDEYIKIFPDKKSVVRLEAALLLAYAKEYGSLSARVRRGQADAASQGRPIGRPRKGSIIEIWQLHREGLTSREISRKCGVSDATVSRYLHSECPPEATTKKAV